MELIKDWMNRANSAYQYAIVLTNDEVYYEDKCFQAQQAAEKAIKALLIFYDVNPEYTHDISKLLKALENYTKIDDFIKEASQLTQYAVITRYTNSHFVVTEEMFLEAIELAKKCLEWVKKKIDNTN